MTVSQSLLCKSVKAGNGRSSRKRQSGRRLLTWEHSVARLCRDSHQHVRHGGSLAAGKLNTVPTLATYVPSVPLCRPYGNLILSRTSVSDPTTMEICVACQAYTVDDDVEPEKFYWFVISLVKYF